CRPREIFLPLYLDAARCKCEKQIDHGSTRILTDLSLASQEEAAICPREVFPMVAVSRAYQIPECKSVSIRGQSFLKRYTKAGLAARARGCTSLWARSLPPPHDIKSR